VELFDHDIHCVQKKTPTHVFFYISVENVSICTKFSRYVCEELCEKAL